MGASIHFLKKQKKDKKTFQKFKNLMIKSWKVQKIETLKVWQNTYSLVHEKKSHPKGNQHSPGKNIDILNQEKLTSKPAAGFGETSFPKWLLGQEDRGNCPARLKTQELKSIPPAWGLALGRSWEHGNRPSTCTKLSAVWVSPTVRTHLGDKSQS